MEPNKPIIEKTDESRTSDTNNRKSIHGLTIDELYDKALYRYGYDGQVLKLVEELSELIQILMKEQIQNEFKEHQNQFIKTKIINEWADVKIMMEQIERYYNADTSIDFTAEVEEMMFFKLQKLSQKLKS